MACKIELGLKSLQSNPQTCLSAIRKYLINMLIYFAGMLLKENSTPLHPTHQQSRIQNFKLIDWSSIRKDSRTHWLKENSKFLNCISLFHLKCDNLDAQPCCGIKGYGSPQGKWDTSRMMDLGTSQGSWDRLLSSWPIFCDSLIKRALTTVEVNPITAQ